MSARWRKLIGMVAILAFLAAYVAAAVWIGERLPEGRWIDLAYYAFAGLAWGVPLLPLISWMNRGR